MKNKMFLIYLLILLLSVTYQIILISNRTQKIIQTQETQQNSIIEIQTQIKENTTVSRGGNFRTLTVLATAYCPCKICCGSGATGHTYTGTIATEGRTIAVDSKVIPLGSKVLIDGNKYIAEDTGNAIKGNRIDIFYNSHQEALKFGKQTITIRLED